MVTSADAICGLEPQLPTVSVKDTAQTILEIDNFNSKFRSGCNIQKKKAP